MNEVIFWGGTGHALVLREALIGTGYELTAVFDNRPLASPFKDIPVYLGEAGFAKWLRGRTSDRKLYGCIAVGGARGEERLALQRWLQEQGVEPLCIKHPRGFIASDVALGLGVQVLAMAAVCAGAQLGDAVIVNTSASVDHGCVIGNGVHVGPGAHLAGEVSVHEHAFIGTGGIVLPRLTIGRGAIVGAGAVVTRDVAPGEIVVGSPAKPAIHR